MDDVIEEIVNGINDLQIDCPDCKYMSDDEQYTCTTCWCEGGNGRINVVQWIKENPKHFNL
jgi:hypothetical protein